MPQHGTQRAFIPWTERIEHGLCPREGSSPRRFDLVCRHELFGEQRNDCERENQRNEYRDRQRGRQRREELTDDALQQAERQKDDDRRQGRGGNGPDQLLHRFADRPRAVPGQSQMTRDVFRNDDRVVDDEPDRDRHGPQRHQVERLAQQPHHEHGDREGQRNRGGADRRDAPVAQEDEQHDHRERRADEHGVADGAHGLPHEERLVVHPLDVNAGRQRRCDRRHDPGDAVREGERIAAELARDVDQRRRPAVARDDAHVILGADLHGGKIPHVQSTTHDHVADVVRGVGFLIGDDQILAVVLGHSADGLYRDGAADGVGEITVGQAVRSEPSRIGDHLDLAHIGALHVHPPDARHAREQRLDVVARQIVEGGRVAALDVVGDNREQRGRELLDLDLQIGRQRRLNLIHAGADQLQRAIHIRAGRERDRDFRRPTNRV